MELRSGDIYTHILGRLFATYACIVSAWRMRGRHKQYPDVMKTTACVSLGGDRCCRRAVFMSPRVCSLNHPNSPGPIVVFVLTLNISTRNTLTHLVTPPERFPADVECHVTGRT